MYSAFWTILQLQTALYILLCLITEEMSGENEPPKKLISCWNRGEEYAEWSISQCHNNCLAKTTWLWQCHQQHASLSGLSYRRMCTICILNHQGILPTFPPDHVQLFVHQIIYSYLCTTILLQVCCYFEKCHHLHRALWPPVLCFSVRHSTWLDKYDTVIQPGNC